LLGHLYLSGGKSSQLRYCLLDSVEMVAHQHRPTRKSVTNKGIDVTCRPGVKKFLSGDSFWTSSETGLGRSGTSLSFAPLLAFGRRTNTVVVLLPPGGGGGGGAPAATYLGISLRRSKKDTCVSRIPLHSVLRRNRRCVSRIPADSVFRCNRGWRTNPTIFFPRETIRTSVSSVPSGMVTESSLIQTAVPLSVAVLVIIIVAIAPRYWPAFMSNEWEPGETIIALQGNVDVRLFRRVGYWRLRNCILD
jgi:hypothetical protein